MFIWSQIVHVVNVIMHIEEYIYMIRYNAIQNNTLNIVTEETLTMICSNRYREGHLQEQNV